MLDAPKTQERGEESPKPQDLLPGCLDRLVEVCIDPGDPEYDRIALLEAAYRVAMGWKTVKRSPAVQGREARFATRPAKLTIREEIEADIQRHEAEKPADWRIGVLYLSTLKERIESECSDSEAASGGGEAMQRSKPREELRPHAGNGQVLDPGGRVQVEKDGRVLYASPGFALDRALEKGWKRSEPATPCSTTGHAQLCPPGGATGT